MGLATALRILMTRSFAPFRFQPSGPELAEYRELDPLGLYVHIPFCRRLCGFCPYCKTVYDPALAERYRKALLREIELIGENGAARKAVSSLYFGGGTPALLADGLKEIVDCLRCYFDILGGIGVELHPDDVEPGVLKKLRDVGVTMVSIGVQSFQGECRKALGRGEEGKLLREKVALAASMGFSAVDVDLIFAIPGQTEESLLADLDTAFESGATQVSTYPFIDFTFAQNRRKPLSRREKKRMLKALSAHALKRGLERTSVWTFARAGTERYSSVTREAFLGFGVSAASLLKQEFRLNTFSVEDYADRLEAGQSPSALTLRFTPRQRACYHLFWSCYSMELNPEAFLRTTGLALERAFGPELFFGRLLGLLRKEEKGCRLTERGALWYHGVEQAYTRAYIDKTWRISRGEAFPKGFDL